jgi:hypothetical protein
VFCKNRDRLLDGDIAKQFLAATLSQPQVRSLLSNEHFSVDGTLIEAWASLKSFVPKDGGDKQPPSGDGSTSGGGRNRERDFHGEKRRNDTHSSTTDPDARLFRKGKGKEAKLCHMGHILIENRNGLIVDACLTEANGTAERSAALDMVEANAGRGSTVAGDKNYDTADFVAGCRERGCTPHVAQNNTNRRSAIDARTTRHPGYAVSQVKRKRVEEPFGWMKTVAPCAVRDTAVGGWSSGSSSSPLPPTISSAFRNCLLRRRDESVRRVENASAKGRKPPRPGARKRVLRINASSNTTKSTPFT